MHQQRDLGKKVVQSAGQNVDVATIQLADATVVYEITATVGAYTEKQRHVIGASGTNPIQPPALTAAQLQTALDGFRQRVADNAAWHAAMEAATLVVS